MPESKHIGKYEIIDELGRGGFAVVYRARDTVLDRIVALKVLHAHVAEDVTFVQRFEQEARTAARFDHPHIVTIFEVGQEAGQHYIAMNYLPGRVLDERLAEANGPLPLEQVIAIVDQVADALDYIHQRGAVHRDVKPSNVRLSHEGHATLLDFGIVRAADGTRLTTTGEMMGTPQYMSPEQAEGQEIDRRSDIYSLGVMAYQMCTGEAPFDDVSPLVVLRLHADKAPPPPRELNTNLPASVEPVLLKALAKRPDERYQSAGDFARALREAEAGLQRARQRLRRPRILTLPTWVRTVGGVAILGLLVGSLWLAFGGGAAITPTREPTDTPAPTSALTPEPTDTPAPTGTPTREPTDTPAPTSTLTSEPTDTPAPTGTPTRGPTDTPGPTSTPTREPTDTPAPASTPTRETAGPPAGEPWTRPADGMVMVYVPRGTFPMGSDDDEVEYALQLCNEYRSDCERTWFEDEQPVHDVTLDGFWLDQTQVTNAQFAAFLNDQGNQTEGGVTWLDIEDEDCLMEQSGGEFQPKSDYADHPVIEVSWYGAAAYCEWAGARLPTEAQWEYAARGPQGHLYPWGDDDPTCDLAQYGDCSRHTVPVGSLPDGASWCGALDMAGNVLEWVADWYEHDYYWRSPSENPVGPEEDHRKVLRGGSWGSTPDGVRGAYRSKYSPGRPWYVVGFRCARGSQ